MRIHPRPLLAASMLLAVSLGTIAALAACASPEPQTVVVEKEVVKEVVVEVPAQDTNIEATVEAHVATALATAIPQATDTPTPASTPTAAPPRPTATPRVSEEVVIRLVTSDNTLGTFDYYERYGHIVGFRNAGDLLDYLLKEGVLTSSQRRTLLRGDEITVSDDKLSVAMYKLLESKGEKYLVKQFGINKGELDRRILRNFDESLLDSPQAARAANPTPTPRVSEDVVIRLGGDAHGTLGYEGEFGVSNYGFKGIVVLDYLHKEGVLTSAQRRVARTGEPITVSGDDVAVAMYKLLESKGEKYLEEQFGIDKPELGIIFRNFDESLLDSAYATTTSEQDGYIVIREGSLETVVTDEDGNTTRVRIDTVDAEEFLDYLLSRGKITVQQRDAYGDSRELQLSLKDAADILDFPATDDDLFIGIEKDDLDYIRKELLPLFSLGD